LIEERQQAPSLMRQCRVAIRRQLSLASCHRTILPAIDQLPLPSRLQQYLKFERSDTEVDLEVKTCKPVKKDNKGASTSSDDDGESSWSYDSE